MRRQNFGVTNKEYYGMLLYFLEWSIQCRIQSLRWGGGGEGEWVAVIQTLRKGGAVSEKFFSTVGHQYGLKIRGTGSLDPSHRSVTAIIRGRIIMAMRTVYVEYCKLPLIRLPTFKPFPLTYVPIYS